MVPNFFAQLVRVAKRSLLHGRSEGSLSRRRLEQAAAEPEFGVLAWPFNDDARVPNALEALSEKQPRPLSGATVGDVVHPERHVEFFPPQHDVQEIVIAQLGVLFVPLAGSVLLQHLRRPRLFNHSFRRGDQALADAQEACTREPMASAGLSHSGLEVHLHPPEDLRIFVQCLAELVVHLLPRVEGRAVAFEGPVVDPLRHVHPVVALQVHVLVHEPDRFVDQRRRRCILDGPTLPQDRLGKPPIWHPLAPSVAKVVKTDGRVGGRACEADGPGPLGLHIGLSHLLQIDVVEVPPRCYLEVLQAGGALRCDAGVFLRAQLLPFAGEPHLDGDLRSHVAARAHRRRVRGGWPDKRVAGDLSGGPSDWP
mmetsp:Transcript_119059/g.336742  ORF Transcript_119059/g.336742 Transcript_119059/m.336742 type:complete len:367 (+) Transcript_119059:560-1660(+)